MTHVKFHEYVIRCNEIIAFDCLNTNEFGATHVNIHFDAQIYPLESP